MRQLFKLSIVHKGETCLNYPNGGRSVSRNRGAQAATGEFLIFLDDDMRATRTLVEEHMNQHIDKKYKIVVGGQIEELSK